MNSQLKLWIYRAALLLVWSLGFLFWGRSCTSSAPAPADPSEKTDTLIIRDTIIIRDTVTIKQPKPATSEKRDSMLAPVGDTVVIHDTTYLVLPRETKTYGDERYTAVVSGYNPSLDRLEIYLENQVVTKVAIPQATAAPPKRWGLGVQVGAGATLQGQTVRVSPYVGVGISYNILSW